VRELAATGRSGADPASPPSLVVLHEDDAMIVIDKPSGLAVHRGLSPDRDTVVARLLAAGRPPHVVHRLDRATSGALVVAQTAASAARLVEAFAAGAVEKEYLAIVRGAPPPDVHVDHPIPRDEGGARVDAVTDVRTLAVGELLASSLRERRYALVAASPRTGRFHQVRRHLKHLGHPIVGDTTYGRSEHNRAVREATGLGRLALHAARVVVGGTAVVAPLPEDLVRACAALGLSIDRA
jgi:tRNA pseudouridine65 synthase